MVRLRGRTSDFEAACKSTSQPGFVKSKDERAAAWQAPRRLTRTLSGLLSEAQSDEQAARICAQSFWTLLDPDCSGVIDGAAVELVSSLTRIAATPGGLKRGDAGVATSAKDGQAVAGVLAACQDAEGRVPQARFERAASDEAATFTDACAPSHTSAARTHRAGLAGRDAASRYSMVH